MRRKVSPVFFLPPAFSLPAPPVVSPHHFPHRSLSFLLLTFLFFSAKNENSVIAYVLSWLFLLCGRQKELFTARCQAALYHTSKIFMARFSQNKACFSYKVTFIMLLGSFWLNKYLFLQIFYFSFFTHIVSVMFLPHCLNLFLFSLFFFFLCG